MDWVLVIFLAAAIVGIIGAWIQQSLAALSAGLIALAFFLQRV